MFPLIHVLKSRIAVIIILAITFTACTNEADLYKEMAESSPKTNFLRSAYAMLEAGELEALHAQLAPHLQDAEMNENLRVMHEQLPADVAINHELIRFGSVAGDGRVETNIAMEYEYEDGFRLVSGTVSVFDGELRLVGLGIYPREKSIAADHRLTLSGKSFLHVGFVVLALGLIFFTLWTWVKSLQTKGLWRKGWWSVLILVGVFRLSLNWTTGSLQADVFAVQLLNGGLSSQGAFSPWLVSISFPLGAIVFWTLHIRRRRQLEDSMSTAEQTEATEGPQPSTHI